MRWIIFIAVILIGVEGYSQKIIRVGLYYVSTVRTAQVTFDQGVYLLKGDTSILDTLKSEFQLTTSVHGKQVKAKLNGSDLGYFDTIKLVQIGTRAGFKIRSLTHDSKNRPYWGDLEFSIGEGKLKMVNTIELEEYLPGVVESESGSRQGVEYYKIQATISRTYAHSHSLRHLEEGFNVCDHTHCQVYRKKSMRNPDIPKAVKESAGMVLVDSDINLITASFFSNCGGQTCNSEDVWSSRLDYLRSIKDPFCKSMPHHYWKKEISKDKWIQYVKGKMPSYFKNNNTFDENFKIDYRQGKRRIYYSNAGFSIQLKDVRADFKLRSTFFSITEENGKLLFKGKGFGHGVGLCQEGAMKMSNLGYSYLEILKFYYSGIHLIHLDDLEFFRME
jgi:stage II sporulation protein D